MSGQVNDKICVAWIGPGPGPYHYKPSLGAGVTFCILFFLSGTFHSLAAICSRRWWQLVFTVGALGETIGWIGRAWSSKCPYENTPFLIQVSTLIFSPAWFTAGTYVILGRLIVLFGNNVSPLKPSTYLFIFCSVDFMSLILQAAGGGLAASTLGTSGNPITGTDIMITGIIFQLISILVFSALFVYILRNARKAGVTALRDRKIKFLIAGTAFCVTMMVIRGIYRTIEMLEGWHGYLITTESYFIALDGSMMILAVVVFNFISPGWSEGRKKEELELEMQSFGGEAV